MTAVPFTQVAHLLSVDAKTLRQWMKQSNLELAPHSTDARIKCLTIEQVHLLANLHGRVLPPPTQASAASQQPSMVADQMSPVAFRDADLREKLTQLEAQLASQQAQIAALSLQLLQERQQRTEQRLLTLETFFASTGGHPFQLQAETRADQPQALPEALPPTEKRTRLVPLIASSASGSYVLICPKEGELPITPDTPEWFMWLASLSSFRFVGQSGRLSARRGSSPHSRGCWYARRIIHQHEYCKYIGVTHHVTIARLEQIAQTFQSYVS
jgi:hypothetical protein